MDLEEGTEDLMAAPIILGAFCGAAIGIILLLALLNIISITSIIIGALHLKDCPAEPNIPVMLITMGVLGIVIGILDSLGKKSEGDEDCTPCCNCISVLLKITKLALFIYTCVIVYRIYTTVSYTPIGIPPGPDLSLSLNGTGTPGVAGAAEEVIHYCNRVVYLYTFWLLTITLSLVGLALLCACCCMPCAIAAN